MNCNDAVALGDGREVFVLKMDFTITSFVDSSCVALLNGDTEDQTKIVLQDCSDAGAFEDNRHMWKFGDHGAILSMKDEE